MLSALATVGGGVVQAPPAPPPPAPTPAPATTATIAAGYGVVSPPITAASASPPPDAATLAAAGITLQQFLDAQAAGLGAGAGTQVLLAGGTMAQAIAAASEVTQEVAASTGADGGGGGDAGTQSGVEDTTLQAYKPPGIVAQWRNLIDVFKVDAPSRQNTIQGMFDSPKEFWK